MKFLVNMFHHHLPTKRFSTLSDPILCSVTISMGDVHSFLGIFFCYFVCFVWYDYYLAGHVLNWCHLLAITLIRLSKTHFSSKSNVHFPTFSIEIKYCRFPWQVTKHFSCLFCCFARFHFAQNLIYWFQRFCRIFHFIWNAPQFDWLHRKGNVVNMGISFWNWSIDQKFMQPYRLSIVVWCINGTHTQHLRHIGWIVSQWPAAWKYKSMSSIVKFENVKLEKQHKSYRRHRIVTVNTFKSNTEIAHTHTHTCTEFDIA